jgi:hypothetical protein
MYGRFRPIHCVVWWEVALKVYMVGLPLTGVDRGDRDYPQNTGVLVVDPVPLGGIAVSGFKKEVREGFIRHLRGTPVPKWDGKKDHT